ncbi:MAG: hypothetical protein JST89_13620 [Cyanobacteria bacterium SZAS-4]|nr:hypothetical protein [Cyanobacteria bacterium SZAS-4]
MGWLDNLFKPKAQPEEDANRSTLMMERLKARRGQETGKWLALMEDASREAPAPTGPAPTIEDIDKRDVLDEAPYVPPLAAQFAPMSDNISVAPSPTAEEEGNRTVAGVQMLFAEFQRQADEYNASADTQMMLTVNHPTFTFEAPNYEESSNPSARISIFKGYVVAQHWAMLVQGYEEKIDVYVIAADEILNFTLNDIRNSGVSPYMTVESAMVDDRRVWNIAGTPISLDTIPLLSKELLGDLIRVSTGTMDESELFTDLKTKLKLGETVGKGYSSTNLNR